MLLEYLYSHCYCVELKCDSGFSWNNVWSRIKAMLLGDGVRYGGGYSKVGPCVIQPHLGEHGRLCHSEPP